MSTENLTVAESAMAAIADIEDITQELLVTLSDAQVLVEHLAGALVDCGIQPATHPDIAGPLELLRRLLADHAASADAKPTLGEIAERVRYKSDLFEE